MLAAQLKPAPAAPSVDHAEAVAIEVTGRAAGAVDDGLNGGRNGGCEGLAAVTLRRERC